MLVRIYTVIIVIVPLLYPRAWPSCHVVAIPLMYQLINKKKITASAGLCKLMHE